MAPDMEVLVVGGGVIGLAITRALLARGRDVTVIERHSRLGTETSSRNSEVIHAGLYYPPGSLRARLCVEGKALLYRFAAENNVAVRRYGKLLVATTEAELPRLQAIAETAARNGVHDLRSMTASDTRAIEPELACVAAYLSPSTGVIDSHGLLAALEGHVLSLGGTVAPNTMARSITPGTDKNLTIDIESANERAQVTARTAIVAAGHGASSLARTVAYDNGYEPPATYPAKGHYFSLAGKSPFRHLVYPMPQGDWLGIHLTLDTAGRAKFGPDIEWRKQVSYEFEDRDGQRQKRFEREIRRYWPGLPEGVLTPDYTGIRPKIYRSGEPSRDFRIDCDKMHGVHGLIALYGIESPGLTSCLAIGELVAGIVDRT